MRIVIVNPNPLRRSAFATVIAPIAPTAEIVTVPELATARRALADAPSRAIIVLEVDPTTERGLAVLESLHNEFPQARIVITAPQPLGAAALLDAANRGGCGYIPSDARPEVLADALLAVTESLDADASAAAPATSAVAPIAVPTLAPKLTAGRDFAVLLTPRQLEVLQLLVRGLPNKTIGRELDLAPSTVKAHISAILRSLQARSRTEAVIAAIRQGLVPAATTPAARPTAPVGRLGVGLTLPYQAEGSGRTSLMAFASV